MSEPIPKERWSVHPGDKFGMLTVEGEPFYVRYKDTNRRLQHAMFRCECGNLKELGCYEVKQGRIQSCGCLLKKLVKVRFRKGTLASNGFKKCSRCLEMKTVDMFGKDRYTKDGLHACCKDCKTDIQLQHEFGITLREYENLLKRQNGKCACCGANNPGNNRTRFAVDHSHQTGKIRGLLCFRCNVTLGHCNDDSDILQKLIDYLEED